MSGDYLLNSEKSIELKVSQFNYVTIDGQDYYKKFTSQREILFNPAISA